MAEPLPRMYTDLAPWFHLLTAPADYAEEAEIYLRVMAEAIGAPPGTLLELGSGGGNVASHYKRSVAATLVDLSEPMLELSRALNPECEHIAGDMRTVRLGRAFDAVLVHDAVMYLLDEADLERAMATAFVHCRPGGVAVFVPDCVRETFSPATRHGGHDGDGRALRYLEWVTDPDPTDTVYAEDFAYLLHEDGQPPRCVTERHNFGLFGRDDWLRLLGGVGFRATVQQHPVDEDFGLSDVFVAVRPAG
jgi:SAM-dependent methyltransferase